MDRDTIQSGEAFSDEKTQEIVEAFYRDGFAHIPGVLEPSEVEALKKRTDELMDDPELAARVNPNLSDRRYVQMHKRATGVDLPFILRNTIELDAIYLDMLLREPILSLHGWVRRQGLARAGAGDILISATVP